MGHQVPPSLIGSDLPAQSVERAGKGLPNVLFLSMEEVSVSR